MFPVLPRWLPLACSLVFASGARGDVFLSEIAASNDNGETDSDGDYSDWVEIANSGPIAVNLGGWHLTDDALAPRKWEFPPVILDAGAHLLVFASGKDRDNPAAELHTNFSLAAEGEYLAITDGAGLVVDSLVTPPQERDHSYGSLTDAPGSPRVHFATPSPREPNDPDEAMADPPVISPSGRAFTTEVTVTLSAAEDAEIRYTLDGSPPQAGISPLYTGPMVLPDSTRVRAQAFAPGRRASLVSAEGYLRISSEVAARTSNLPLMILDDFGAGAPNAKTAAHWMVFDPASNGRSSPLAPPSVSSAAEMKIRGSSTVTAAKYSLFVEAQTASGNGRSVSPAGLPADADWVLQAPYEFDRALIRNSLAYALGNATGRYAPRTRQVELYLKTNGGTVTAADYFGVYTLTERIERGEDRVPVTKLNPGDVTDPAVSGGYLFKIDRADPGDTGFAAAGRLLYWVDPKEDNVATEQQNWLKGYLNAWWQTLNAPDFYDPVSGYASRAEVDSFVDHHLLNTSMKNVDAFRLSAYFFKDRRGKINAGPLWDFDRSMDSTDDRDDKSDTWCGDKNPLGDQGTDFFGDPWYARMFRDGNFGQRWIDRWEELRKGALSPAAAGGEIDRQAAELMEAAPRNFERWPGRAPRFGGWNGEVEHLRTWLLHRMAWMDGRFTRPPAASLPGGRVTAGTTVSLTSPSLVKPGVRIFYTLDGIDPRLFDTTHGQEIVTTSFIGSDHPVRARVPAADPGPAWRDGSAYDDSSWLAGENGVGYDDQPTYNAFIKTNLEGPQEERRMKGVRQTCLIRYHFQTDAATLAALTFVRLRARYDDGFAAWINGVKIPGDLAPANPPWDAGATANHPDDDAMQYIDFEVADFASVLRPGENVLAVQALNFGLYSTDFLFQAELVGGYVPAEAPEVHPDAIEYTGPITVSSTSHLMARTWDPSAPSVPGVYEQAGGTPTFSRWSAPLRLSFLTGTQAPGPGSLRISELLYRPLPPSSAENAAGFSSRGDFEFLELRNTGATTLDLTGVRVEGDVSALIAPGPHAVLPPGGTVLLVADPAGFALRFGAGLNVAGAYQGQLHDSGATLRLVSADGALLEEITWSDLPPWPQAADGGGPSLERVDFLTSDAAAWRASLDPGGTPDGRGAQTYALWRQRHFPEGGPASGPNDDSDEDGLANLFEYAGGSDPCARDIVAHPVFRREMVDGEPVTSVTLHRRAGLDSQWALEWSADMEEWNAVTEPDSATPAPDGGEILRFAVPDEGESRRMFRLRVTVP